MNYNLVTSKNTIENVYNFYKSDPLKRICFIKHVSKYIFYKVHKINDLNIIFVDVCRLGIIELVRLLVEKKNVDPGCNFSDGLVNAIMKGHWDICIYLLTLHNYGSLDVSTFYNDPIKMLEYNKNFTYFNKRDMILHIIKHSTFCIRYSDPGYEEVFSICIEYSITLEIYKYFDIVPRNDLKEFFKRIKYDPLKYLSRIVNNRLFKFFWWIEQNYDIPNNIKLNVTHSAICVGNLEILNCMIKKYNVDPNFRRGVGLRNAVKYNHYIMVKYLLQYSHINIIDFNNSAFTKSIENGNLKIARLLYNKDPLVKKEALKSQDILLKYAGYTGNPQIVRFLIDIIGCSNPRFTTIEILLRCKKRRAEDNAALMEFCKDSKYRKILDKKVNYKLIGKLVMLHNTNIQKYTRHVKIIYCIVKDDRYWGPLPLDIRIKIIKMVWPEKIKMDKFLYNN